LQSGALIGVTRTDANTVQHADIVAMWARMSPRNKPNAAWYINSEVHPKLDALYFPGSTTSVLSPYVSYGQDGVMRIYGRPVIETEFNPALGTQGDILLADMREYLYWEKTDIQAATSIHVQFLTDETTFRFVYRCDGQTAYSSPVTPYKGSATQSAFVSLTAAS
jgi:HK97 family phage major capsid protein